MLKSVPLIPFQELILAPTVLVVNLLRYQQTYRGICSLVPRNQSALLIQRLGSQQSLVLLPHVKCKNSRHPLKACGHRKVWSTKDLWDNRMNAMKCWRDTCRLSFYLGLEKKKGQHLTFAGCDLMSASVYLCCQWNRIFMHERHGSAW